jgi:hypothetical protein
MQVATLAGGHTMAVESRLFARFTSPDPTVWSGAATALLSVTAQ